jgi:hypothetical protein
VSEQLSRGFLPVLVWHLLQRCLPPCQLLRMLLQQHSRHTIPLLLLLLLLLGFTLLHLLLLWLRLLLCFLRLRLASCIVRLWFCDLRLLLLLLHWLQLLIELQLLQALLCGVEISDF